MTEDIVAYACLVWGVQLLCHYQNMLGSEYESGALIVEVIGAGVALGVGVALNSHFLGKQWFLSDSS